MQCRSNGIVVDLINSNTVLVKDRGLQDYEPIWQEMTHFTNQRTELSTNEIWMLEHKPIYTLGQAGKPEHLLRANAVPVIKVDRGGQVTYHGPGQLICYPLINLKIMKMGVREFVRLLARSVQQTLAHWHIKAYYDDDAPGVYVEGAKIAALGLRIRRGCSFHGLSLNVDMDLSAFDDINPCGYSGLNVVQMKDFIAREKMPSMSTVKQQWLKEFCGLTDLTARMTNN